MIQDSFGNVINRLYNDFRNRFVKIIYYKQFCSYFYINSMKLYMRKKGAKLAIKRLINDTNIFYDEFMNFEEKRMYNFYVLFHMIVDRLEDIDKELHYFRNKINRAPATLNDLINVNKNLPSNKRWQLLPPIKSAFHMKGKDGIFNVKFVSYDGHFEVVYNKDGVLLNEYNDPLNMGTYNYFGPDNEKMHLRYDVKPYYKWGNTEAVGGCGEIEELATAAANIAKHKLNAEARRYFEEVKSQV